MVVRAWVGLPSVGVGAAEGVGMAFVGVWGVQPSAGVWGVPPSEGRWGAQPSVDNQTPLEPASVWEPSGAVWVRGTVGGGRVGRPPSPEAVGAGAVGAVEVAVGGS